jgi:hypothetical protein
VFGKEVGRFLPRLFERVPGVEEVLLVRLDDGHFQEFGVGCCRFVDWRPQLAARARRSPSRPPTTKTVTPATTDDFLVGGERLHCEFLQHQSGQGSKQGVQARQTGLPTT